MKIRKGRVTFVAAFPVLALFAYMLSTEMGLNYLVASLFASLHELGHLGAMKYFRIKPRKITLGAVGIRIDKNYSDLSYKQECAALLAGPAVNLVFAFIFAFFYRESEIARLCMTVDLGLAFVNLLPAKSLDGGRFIYNVLLMKKSPKAAERISSILSFLCLIFLVAVAVFTLIKGVRNTTLVLFTLWMCVVTVKSLVEK